jgi:hypothetical protein
LKVIYGCLSKYIEKGGLKMSDDFRPKFVPKRVDLSFPKPFFDNTEFDRSMQESEEEMARDREERERKEAEYRETVISTLQGIEKNTALLTEITVLLQKNNDKQDQVFELITEILAITKANSKEEAESKLNDVMGKINAASDGVNSVQSLYTMATTVYTACQALF